MAADLRAERWEVSFSVFGILPSLVKTFTIELTISLFISTCESSICRLNVSEDLLSNKGVYIISESPIIE